MIMLPLRVLGAMRLSDDFQEAGADVMEHSPSKVGCCRGGGLEPGVPRVVNSCCCSLSIHLATAAAGQARKWRADDARERRRRGQRAGERRLGVCAGSGRAGARASGRAGVRSGARAVSAWARTNMRARTNADVASACMRLCCAGGTLARVRAVRGGALTHG